MLDLFDTHCHLNLPDAYPDPDSAIAEARAAGVSRLAVVGIDASTCRAAIELAERHVGVFAIVGWHPNHAANYGSGSLALVRELLRHPRAIAVGEIGLDYHWDFATKDRQTRCLLEQLDLAAETGKPVVFHCRDAYDDLLPILENRPQHPYLLHCFSGTMAHARRAEEIGCLFGVDGPVTYKNAHGLRSIVKALPQDRLVLETDSPYMPPEPHRGKPNKPAYLPLINAAVASCLGLSPADCAAVTTATARRFFGV